MSTVFSKMELMVGAVIAFNELSHLFDVYILSTSLRDIDTVRDDKLRWVRSICSKMLTND